MGKKGRAIVEVDINKLLELLKKAYADEWIAYYAYKWAAKVAKSCTADGGHPKGVSCTRCIHVCCNKDMKLRA